MEGPAAPLRLWGRGKGEIDDSAVGPAPQRECRVLDGAADSAAAATPAISQPGLAAR